MVKLFGGRIASALVGLSVFAMGSSAGAQVNSSLNVTNAVKALDVDASAKALGSNAVTAPALLRPAIASTKALASSTGAIFQAQPARSVTLSLTPSIAREAAWLYSGGWGLHALVDKFATNAPLDEQTNCLATAVYFEARGENVEGQLAVANVVMNRAASGKYPSDWCSVVKQPWQFSFVNPRTGVWPRADFESASWRKAQAVALLAVAKVVPSVSPDVLWYHATYVSPSWGRRLQLASKIGTHIFYRA